LPAAAEVSLQLYDLHGRLVETLVNGEVRPAGPHQAQLDASGLRPGLYFLRLGVPREVTTTKLAIIR
jgi:hypothetical protein